MKQPFSDKFFNFVFLLLALKFASIVFLLMFYSSEFGSVWGAFLLFIIAAIVLLVISAMLSPSVYGDSNAKDMLLENEAFEKLRNKYREMAQKFEDEKQYFKAAGVHMNLLQDNYEAAKTLARGNLYNEAAVVYLKKLNDKNSAASCYELGKNYKKSIDLYLELKNHEKVGDLYKTIQNKEKALHYYNIVTENYLKNDQFVKASLIYRYKIEDANAAQQILMKGWNNNLDAFNCLNNYFVNIENEEILKKEIQNVFTQTKNFNKRETLLEVLKLEYEKHQNLKNPIRKIAYSIISERLLLKKEIASELKFFNKQDKMMDKDVARCKTSSNRMFR